MPEFNLIPPKYILWRQFIKDLRIYLVFILLLAMFGVAGGVLLQKNIENQAKQISSIRKSKAFIDGQHADIRDLNDDKSILESRFNLVSGLKGSLELSDLFVSIDRSLSEDIDFKSWQFNRVSQPDRHDSTNARSSYFVVVDELGFAGSGVNGVAIMAEIKINGMARSHSAMADFMRNLASQQIFNRVELVRSNSGQLESNDAVEFDFLVELVSEQAS